MSFLEHPQSLRWRKALFQIHLWGGLIVGLYVLAISVSGSILVFQRELLNDAPHVDNDQFVAAPHYDELIAIATLAHPSEHFESIDLRTQHRRVVPIALAGASGRRVVYVDSTTQQILREVLLDKAHPVVRWMLSLHTELLTGHSGAVANGIGGLALFLLSISGIVLWWPGKSRWKRSLKVNWRANWRRMNWNLHTVFGFWTMLFIAMWGLTGAYFIWPQQVRDTASRIFPMDHFHERPSTWRPGDPVQKIGNLISYAEQRYPHSLLAFVYADIDRPGGVIKVFLSPDPSQSLTLLEDVVTFQPATGEVLASLSTSNLTPAERVSLAAYSIHFGDFAQLAGKIVWCVLAWVPVLLAVTGYLMWWNRVLCKKFRTVFHPPEKTNRSDR